MQTQARNNLKNNHIGAGKLRDPADKLSPMNGKRRKSRQVPTIKGNAMASPRSKESILPGVKPPRVAAAFSSSVASHEAIFLSSDDIASDSSTIISLSPVVVLASSPSLDKQTVARRRLIALRICALCIDAVE